MRSLWFYMMANRSRTLYAGVTNDLEARVCEHKLMLHDGFTRRYQIDRLVYFEETSDIREAIGREKQVKGWTRAKKIALIESMNPKWEDLSVTLGIVTSEMLRSFRSIAATAASRQDLRHGASEPDIAAAEMLRSFRSRAATSTPQHDRHDA